MKFSSQSLSTLFTCTTASFALVEAIPALPPIETCSEQKECIDITVEELEPALCTRSKCEYEVCLITNYDKPQCIKDSSDFMSHICKKKSNVCYNNGGFGTDTAFEMGNIPTAWKQCQTVLPGGKAEFLLKDGSGCDSGDGYGSDILTLSNGLTASCLPKPGFVETCNGQQELKQCWWKVWAPSTCPKHGGMIGDPHIMRWNGKRLSYHGECDLVLLHSAQFGDGKGLDLHVRTTINKFYSFVDTMALKIGEDVLEIGSQFVYFNGKQQAALPHYISGYPIAEEQEGANKIVTIALHNGDRIEVKIYKKFLAVNVAARPEDFGESVGLLGDFHTGAMLARDGETVIELDDEYGAEWQVQSDEPKLFHDSRSPQLSAGETCRLPAISAGRGLALQKDDFRKEAEEACSSKPADAIDFCIFDVMATGDVGMAGMW